jgi:hypothetical protein
MDTKFVKYLLQDQPSARSEMKPLTWDEVYDSLLLGQGYHILEDAIKGEYGTMVE